MALAFGIVNGLLYMRAFNKLKEKSGVDNFGTAGLLYLIGVFIPLITWIAWIFAAMGFNKLKAAPTAVTICSLLCPTATVKHNANQALPQLRNRKLRRRTLTAATAENHYNNKTKTNKQVRAFSHSRLCFSTKNFISQCFLLLNSKL